MQNKVREYFKIATLKKEQSCKLRVTREYAGYETT